MGQQPELCSSRGQRGAPSSHRAPSSFGTYYPASLASGTAQALPCTRPAPAAPRRTFRRTSHATAAAACPPATSSSALRCAAERSTSASMTCGAARQAGKEAGGQGGRVCGSCLCRDTRRGPPSCGAAGCLSSWDLATVYVLVASWRCAAPLRPPAPGPSRSPALCPWHRLSPRSRALRGAVQPPPRPWCAVRAVAELRAGLPGVGRPPTSACRRHLRNRAVAVSPALSKAACVFLRSVRGCAGAGVALTTGQMHGSVRTCQTQHVLTVEGDTARDYAQQKPTTCSPHLCSPTLQTRQPPPAATAAPISWWHVADLHGCVWLCGMAGDAHTSPARDASAASGPPPRPQLQSR
jgi:hypothetical protein